MNHYYNLFTSSNTLCNGILFESHVIVAGVMANRWTRKIRRMVGAYCNGYMTTWVTWRRTFTAVGRVQHYSVRFISPEDILYIYIYIYTYTFNNNNIYSIHVGIIITGMRARMWYYYVCVRSGRKTSFEHNNRQRATVWELRCIRGAVAGLKEWEWQGEGGPQQVARHSTGGCWHQTTDTCYCGSACL